MVSSEDLGEYRLKLISFPKYVLHSSFSRGKEVREKEVTWSYGFVWDIDTNDTEWDRLSLYAMLSLNRKTDNFTIAKLHVTSVYEVSKGISFKTKYKILTDTANMQGAQVQGAWRVKIQNPSVARILPQSYDRIVSLETDLKRMIYEKWE